MPPSENDIRSTIINTKQQWTCSLYGRKTPSKEVGRRRQVCSITNVSSHLNTISGMEIFTKNRKKHKHWRVRRLIRAMSKPEKKRELTVVKVCRPAWLGINGSRHDHGLRLLGENIYGGAGRDANPPSWVKFSPFELRLTHEFKVNYSLAGQAPAPHDTIFLLFIIFIFNYF